MGQDEIRDDQKIKMLQKLYAVAKDNDQFLSPWAWNDFQEIPLNEKGKMGKHIS